MWISRKIFKRLISVVEGVFLYQESIGRKLDDCIKRIDALDNHIMHKMAKQEEAQRRKKGKVLINDDESIYQLERQQEERRRG